MTRLHKILRHSVISKDAKRLFGVSLFFAIFLTACDFRPVMVDYRPGRPVDIEVDWSIFNEPSQTGMTLYFYPTDGKPPVTHSTNDIDRTTVTLREGSYDVIVMNQSPGEFGSFRFAGMDSYNGFYVRTADLPTKWYTTKTETEKVGWNPERIAFDIAENFEVTAVPVEERLSRNRSAEPLLRLTPVCVVYRFKVVVHVNKIYNMRSVRAAMAGLAEGYIPSEGSTGPNKVTQLLEEGWNITRLDADPTKGTLTTEFATFGLPTVSKAPLPEDVVFKLSCLLVDNKTVEDFVFHIGTRIKQNTNDDGALTFSVEIGVPDEEAGAWDGQGHDPNTPPELSDVQPEGGSGGGFDVEVKDWGEIVDVEIQM